jgi:hypothetical protein
VGFILACHFHVLGSLTTPTRLVQSTTSKGFSREAKDIIQSPESSREVMDVFSESRREFSAERFGPDDDLLFDTDHDVFIQAYEVLYASGFLNTEIVRS